MNASQKALLVFCVCALPVLIAIWFVHWFVTQDGPLQLYNAYLSTELSRGNSFLASVYAPRSELLPYLGGYKVSSWLILNFSDRTAGRLLMSITLLGPACSIIWLRWRVRGWDKLQFVISLALLMAMSKLWLLGLYPFLMGACLFPVTLGTWWLWRDDLKTVRVIIIAALLVAGYFFHIISASFTLAGIVILAIATPSQNGRKRLAWTAASIVPVAFLILRFGIFMRSSSTEGAEWTGLSDASSFRDWLQYLQAPDFLSFSFKTNLGDVLSIATDCPFVREPSTQYALLTPSLWALVGLILLVVSALKGGATYQRVVKSEYRGWVLLVVFLLVVGLLGPASLGQGSIMRERVLLFATFALVPLLRFDTQQPATRLAVVALTLALVLQMAFVWDYALISTRTAGDFMEAKKYVGTGKKAALVLTDTSTHYLISPLPNIANQLGIDSNNVIWNNWWPTFYYFPVAFRDESARENSAAIILLNDLFIRGEAEELSRRDPKKWAAVLDSALREVDTLVVWGAAPWFDAATAKWYDREPVFERGGLRVFKHN